MMMKLYIQTIYSSINLVSKHMHSTEIFEIALKKLSTPCIGFLDYIVISGLDAPLLPMST